MKTIIALYDSLDDARQAVQDLATLGVNGRLITSGDLSGWDIPAADAGYYAEGLRRGGALVAVRAAGDDATSILDVMNRANPVDAEQRAAIWRREGWSGFEADSYPEGNSFTNASEQAFHPRQMDIDRPTKATPAGRLPEDYSRLESHPVAAGGAMDALRTGFHTHFESLYLQSGRPFSLYERAYRFGYEAALDERYRGREWDHVAADIEADWANTLSGAWQDFKAAIRHAWDAVRGNLRHENENDEGEEVDDGRLQSAIAEPWSKLSDRFAGDAGRTAPMDDPADPAHSEHNGAALYQLLVEELRDVYDAEQQIVAAFPGVIDAVESSELRQALSDHLSQTRGHVARLEEIFRELRLAPEGKTCQGMQGLLREAGHALEQRGPSAARDAALIGAVQRVEHYEIASYGTARTHARELAMHDLADLLQFILDEEGQANKLLTTIAEGGLMRTGVNEMAGRQS